VLLALHNDSLRRQLEIRVIDLSASRRRVVERADQTRAALERDLHDGAQQRVLALRIASSQGQSAATARGETDVAKAFQDAGQAAQETLEGLRALAGSVHPAILEGAGLRAALQHLADSHRSPFVLDASGLAALPQDLERTGYAIIRDAARHGVSRVTVSTAPDLHLDVVTRANVPDTVRDRVAAAGGTIREHCDGWEARLPCE
jgi:signal transduction histidine kinase